MERGIKMATETDLLTIRIWLEELITERAGMVVANMERTSMGLSLSYEEAHFAELGARIHELAGRIS